MSTCSARSRLSSVATRKSARGPRQKNYPGEIRIIGGRWRSRRLPVLVSDGLRPTPDRVRETLFNWLTPYVPGARCLDLFAGTGALCLEALSRGAANVVMVEHSPEAARQLRANVERLPATDATVVALDALEYLAGSPTVFDIVFLDPPFAVAESMLKSCSVRLVQGWMKPGGLVYVEAPAELALPLPTEWEPIKSKVAGQVGYHLLRLPSSYT
ncbi:MAG: 16S rRNA (guanine(966)-N(2))-methyltransferase RsmD [Gammaproteobacteria bacterium]|nr:16S rRNA (guanine(966)-N(2))-methyltransferase RsmD [Gammaproteobacteria bacterium]